MSDKKTVTGLAGCQKKDIARAYEAVKETVDPQIDVFLATSDIHLQFKLKMIKTEVLASIKEHVSYTPD